jgi:hypothetical protein
MQHQMLDTAALAERFNPAVDVRTLALAGWLACCYATG